MVKFLKWRALYKLGCCLSRLVSRGDWPTPGSLPQRHQEHHAFTFRVGREESGYLVVVKRQARGPQSLGIGCQVDLPAVMLVFSQSSSVRI